MYILKKVNALIKYEMINLRRGILIWSIIALYIFGYQQVISSMFSNGNSFLSLQGLTGNSWLPLNFIMIPFLLLNMKIGESENDIFKTLDITPAKIFLSKIITSFIVGLIIFIANFIIMVVISLLCKVSMAYFITLLKGHVVNTVMFLITTSALGLFAGQVISKHLGNVLTFILLLILFVFLCNFYKTSNLIFPLISIKSFASSIDVIIYDKIYLYHNLFWILIIFISYIFIYYGIKKQEKTLRAYILPISLSIIVVIACTYMGIIINTMKPDYYDIASRADIEYSNYNSDDATFFCNDNVGFTIVKYNMNINIDNILENTCNMNISVNDDKVSSLELGLYRELNISELLIDGKSVDFSRTNNSFKVILEREYTKGEIINMKVVYNGMINTKWLQGRGLFYARNNGIFLGDVFEWYPKLNDSNEKDYTIKIKYNSNNKIYSNMEESISGNEYIFQGRDREIFLISSPLIKERIYQDYLIIGNEELVNNDKMCNTIIDIMGNNTDNRRNITKLVFAPFIPGESKMDKDYIKAYLYAIY